MAGGLLILSREDVGAAGWAGCVTECTMASMPQTTGSDLQRLVLGSAFAASFMLLWGILFWHNPLIYRTVSHLEHEEQTARLLRSEFPEPGVYFIPGVDPDSGATTELSELGPIATIHIHGPSTMPWYLRFLLTWSIDFLTAFLLGYAMCRVRPELGRYRQRLVFIGCVAAAAALFPNLAEIVWWRHPVGWNAVVTVYTFIAWLIAGCLLAVFVKPDRQGEPPTAAAPVP